MQFDNPKFFFTLSFLVSFVKEYGDAASKGKETTHMDAFKHFLLNSNGGVLIDCKLNLEPYPILRRILRTDGPQYSIFTSDSSNTHSEDLDAIIQHAATFTLRYSRSQLTALESQFQKPIFDIGDVLSKWNYLCGNELDPLIQGTKLDWEKYLSKFLAPTSQVILCDKYLARDRKSFTKNFIPIIKALSAITQFSGTITLISTKPAIEYDIGQIIEGLGVQAKIKLILVPSERIVEEHDRRLITDNMSLNIGPGFDLIDNNDKIRSNTEPSLTSIFSGQSKAAETHGRLLNALYTQAEELLLKGHYSVQN